jgi:hypothetical protein
MEEKKIWQWSDGSWAGCKLLEAADKAGFAWKNTSKTSLSKIKNPEFISVIMLLSSVSPKEIPTYQFIGAVLDMGRNKVMKIMSELAETGIIMRYRCVSDRGSFQHGFRLNDYPLKIDKKSYKQTSDKECVFRHSNLFQEEKLISPSAEEVEVSKPKKKPNYSKAICEERCRTELKEVWELFLQLTWDENENLCRSFCIHWDLGKITRPGILQLLLLKSIGKFFPRPTHILARNFDNIITEPDIKEELDHLIMTTIREQVELIPATKGKGFHNQSIVGAYTSAKSFILNGDAKERAVELLTPNLVREPVNPLIVGTILYEVQELATLLGIEEVFLEALRRPHPSLSPSDFNYVQTTLRSVSDNLEERPAGGGDDCPAFLSDAFMRVSDTTFQEHKAAIERLGYTMQQVSDLIESHPETADKKLDLHGIKSLLCPYLI